MLYTNANDETPLHIACKFDENKDIVKDLLKYNAKQQLEAENEVFGNTPLHIAACLGNTQIVSEILNCENIDHKTLLNKRNKLNDTPAHGAASRGHVQ